MPPTVWQEPFAVPSSTELRYGERGAEVGRCGRKLWRMRPTLIAGLAKLVELVNQ